jgi:predicted class III extradiol MEMO1 family dioxygenase
MNIKIYAKTKEQKESIRKTIFNAVKDSWGLIGVSDMLHYENKEKGRDYQGCSIHIIDIVGKIDYKDSVPKSYSLIVNKESK